MTRLTQQAFKDVLHTTFEIATKDQPFSEQVDLLLSDVTTNGALLQSSPPNSFKPLHREESFSLIFKGPLAPQISQGLITLNHQSIGELEEVFIVPTHLDGNHIVYEAIYG